MNHSYFWKALGIFICSVCFGQSVSIGVVGGGMVSNNLDGPWLRSVSTRYVIGPELDIGLPLGFGIEIDALHRHEGYESTFSSVYIVPANLYANSWEFPCLLKKSFGPPLVKPFVEAGYVPRGIQQTSVTASVASQGFVAGGGAQIGIGRLHLSPAIRYTHWNNNPVLLVIPNGPSPYLSSYQVDALVGITWKLR